MDSNKTNSKNSKKDEMSVTVYAEFPLTYYGGGERLIIDLYKFLKGKSIHIKVYENTARNRETRIEQQTIDSIVGNDLIAHEFVRYGFPHFFYQDFPEIEELINSEGKINLIFSRRIPPKSILEKLSKSEKSYVFCLHGVALEELKFASVRILTHQIIMRHQLNLLSKFIKKNIYVQCLLPKVNMYLRERSAENQNVFTIENEISQDDIKLLNNLDYFQVVFVGRMQNINKGIKLLSKIVRRVIKNENSIRFVIIGQGPDVKYLNSVKRIAKIMEEANDSQKDRILQNSNLAIITSNLEPFSIVAEEFLLAGIPIVATPSSGPSYILGKNEKYGTVSSFDPKVFCEQILHYYLMWKQDRESYFKMRQEIAALAKNDFSKEHMLSSYLNMINRIGKR